MNTAELLQKLRNVISTQDFVSRHKISKKAFTRKRILSFQTTFAIILNGVKDSTTAELDKFSQFFKTAEPTKSAFSQARHKIKASAFIELNDILIQEYYNSDIKIMPHKRFFFNNLTLLGIDGYDLQLPTSEEIKEHFGYATNGSKKVMPMSTASELYDLENKLTICAINSSYATGEGSMALGLVKNFLNKNLNKDTFLFIFDRGYPSLFLLIYLTLLGIKFVMRCNTQFLSEVNEAVRSRRKDQIIDISFKKLKKHDKEILCADFPGIDLLSTLTIRVCLVKLTTGLTEILLTNLIDKKKYPHKIFLKLYSKRWGIETDIGFQKTRLEIENFSGESVLAVQQEFHSAILFKNSTNLLIREAESELFELELETEFALLKDNEETNCEVEVEGELINKTTNIHQVDKYNFPEIQTVDNKVLISPVYELFQKSSDNEMTGGNMEIECKIKLKELPENSIKLKSMGLNKLVNCSIDTTIENFIYPVIKSTTQNQALMKKEKENFEKAVNRSIAFSRMKYRFIAALFASNRDRDVEIFCNDMKKLLKKNLEQVKPGRKFPRKRKYPGKKFHKNSRRVV